MKGYKEFLMRKGQNKQAEQNFLNNLSTPSIKRSFNLPSDYINSSRPTSRSPLSQVDKPKRSMGNLQHVDSKNQTSEYIKETVIKVAEQNARLIEERKSLFRKNCQLVNQINKIRSSSRIKSSKDTIPSRVVTESPCFQEPAEEYSYDLNEIEVDKIAQNSRRNNKHAKYVSQAQIVQGYDEDSPRFNSAKFIRKISAQCNNKQDSQAVDRDLMETHKKHKHSKKPSMHGQLSPCGSEDQIYPAEKTTPIPESSVDAGSLTKNKSSKCFPSVYKPRTISHASNYETTSSYKKISNPLQAQYMLVKMCNHCVHDLCDPANTECIQNATYESQETVSNSYTPKNKPLMSKPSTMQKAYQVNVTPVKSVNYKSALQELQDKIKRIRGENKRLRSEINIQ